MDLLMEFFEIFSRKRSGEQLTLFFLIEGLKTNNNWLHAEALFHISGTPLIPLTRPSGEYYSRRCCFGRLNDDLVGGELVDPRHLIHRVDD
jgi:hypothetical protein